jgi:glycosyltransferase involved in cell wall biosynthesis
VSNATIALIIPARNEELALPQVLARVPAMVSRVLVVDNGSTDATGAVARATGAEVVYESRPGYGAACLAGLAVLRENPPELVAFADADGSDGVENLPQLFSLITAGRCDLALARRIPEGHGALSTQQRFGNWLATRLIRLGWGHRYEDLGPLRAIRWDALEKLSMQDRSFGWTVEMQIRALKARLRVLELPLPYRARIAGTSKISRTVSGVFRAGVRILWVIGRERLTATNATPVALQGAHKGER